MNFGEALDALKEHKRIARASWNGKGMWLRLVEMDFYELLDEKIPEFKRGIDWNLQPWIGIKTAQDMFVPWVAAQSDLLGEDWEVLDV